MPRQIKINNVRGGDSTDSGDLLNCYFEIVGYQLYQANGTKITTVPPTLTSGTGFTFTTPDGVNWTISNFTVDHNRGGGTWTNDHQGPAGDTGTFTAEAGPEPEEEEASSANA